MRRNWKTTSLALVGAILLFGGLWASPAAAQRFVTAYTDDDPINGLAYGVQDTVTGIIWGKTIATGVIHFNVQPTVEAWENAENYDEYGDPNPDSLAGGRTDWRLPTIVEALEAMEGGLADALDFSHEAGPQGVDDKVDPADPDPESPTWGEKWFHTACLVRSGQVVYRYVFRFSDGDHFLQWGGGSVLPICNAGEADHSSCPHKTTGRDKPKKK